MQGLQPSIRKSRTENDETATRPGPLRRHSESLTAQSSFLSPSRAGLHRERSSLSAGREESEIILAPSAHSLQDPNFPNLKLTWIHVPYNNPTWVPVSSNLPDFHYLLTQKDVLERISIEKGPDVHSKMLDHEHWHSKHVRGRHQEHHHACFLKPHCSFFGLESGMSVVLCYKRLIEHV